MHLQILVHPQGVQRGGIKTGKEHIDHDQQIQFLILHTQGNILVVVLELVPVGRIVGMEHCVVIRNSSLQEIP